MLLLPPLSCLPGLDDSFAIAAPFAAITAMVAGGVGGVVDVNDLDNSNDSVASPEHKDSGNKTFALNCSPEFSVDDDVDSVPPAVLPTDNKVSKY
jgi:hypothetical protein